MQLPHFPEFATACALSVTAYAVPALPKGEPRGGRCPPSAPKFLRREIGGAAALGSPYGGAGERSETERAFAVANMRKVP